MTGIPISLGLPDPWVTYPIPLDEASAEPVGPAVRRALADAAAAGGRLLVVRPAVAGRDMVECGVVGCVSLHLPVPVQDVPGVAVVGDLAGSPVTVSVQLEQPATIRCIVHLAECAVALTFRTSAGRVDSWFARCVGEVMSGVRPGVDAAGPNPTRPRADVRAGTVAGIP